jgi:hypothetical protein
MNTILENTNGITIKQLKEFIKDWPEEDQYGNPTEVWISSGKNLSSIAVAVCALNKRSGSDYDGMEVSRKVPEWWADLIIEKAGD